MAEEVKDVNYSSSFIASDPDFFFKDLDVKKSATATDNYVLSGLNVQLGNIQNAVEIITEIKTELTGKGKGILKLEILSSDAPEEFEDADDGDYEVVKAYDWSGKSEVAGGADVKTEVGLVDRFVPEKGDEWYTVRLTTSTSNNVGKINVFQHPVER